MWTRSGRIPGSFRKAAPTGRTGCCSSATRSTPTRSRPRWRPSSARAGTSASLRGRRSPISRSTRALSRVLVGSGHPLAALDRADDDDLRRPRRHRRLEHLAVLGRGDARSAVVGGTDRRAPSWPTGSTSTWATSHRRNSPRKTLFRQVQEDDDAGSAPSRVRAHVRPRVGGQQVGVLPRFRALALAGDRFAGSAGCWWTGGAT